MSKPDLYLFANMYECCSRIYIKTTVNKRNRKFI